MSGGRPSHTLLSNSTLSHLSLLTVYSQVTQSGASSSLHLYVVALKEEHDGFQGVPSNLAHLLFRNLSKREGSRPLQVYIVAEGQGGQRAEGVAREEVGLGAV